MMMMMLLVLFKMTMTMTMTMPMMLMSVPFCTSGGVVVVGRRSRADGVQGQARQAMDRRRKLRTRW
jgi:hypothetical protein